MEYFLDYAAEFGEKLSLSHTLWDMLATVIGGHKEEWRGKSYTENRTLSITFPRSSQLALIERHQNFNQKSDEQSPPCWLSR